MAKPKTIHTLDSLRSLCIEEGDCWFWDAYVQNGSPNIYHDGRMWSVRRLMLELLGQPANRAFVGASCCHALCINPKHYRQRSMSEHQTARAKLASEGPAYQLRIAKLTQTRRAMTTKLTMEIAREIRASEESGPVLAELYGVDRSLVNRVRQGLAWRDQANPFGGLL